MHVDWWWSRYPRIGDNNIRGPDQVCGNVAVLQTTVLVGVPLQVQVMPPLSDTSRHMGQWPDRYCTEAGGLLWGQGQGQGYRPCHHGHLQVKWANSRWPGNNFSRLRSCSIHEYETLFVTVLPCPPSNWTFAYYYEWSVRNSISCRTKWRFIGLQCWKIVVEPVNKSSGLTSLICFVLNLYQENVGHNKFLFILI